MFISASYHGNHTSRCDPPKPSHEKRPNLCKFADCYFWKQWLMFFSVTRGFSRDVPPNKPTSMPEGCWSWRSWCTWPAVLREGGSTTIQGAKTTIVKHIVIVDEIYSPQGLAFCFLFFFTSLVFINAFIVHSLCLFWFPNHWCITFEVCFVFIMKFLLRRLVLRVDFCV